MSHSNIDNSILDSILDTEYIVYTYLTPDYKPGAVIVDPIFRPIFDEKIYSRWNHCNQPP